MTESDRVCVWELGIPESVGVEIPVQLGRSTVYQASPPKRPGAVLAWFCGELGLGARRPRAEAGRVAQSDESGVAAHIE